MYLNHKISILIFHMVISIPYSMKIMFVIYNILNPPHNMTIIPSLYMQIMPSLHMTIM